MLIYRLIYIASVFIGTIATLDLVWLFADTFNGLMAVPNLIALLLLSGVIAKESKDFIAKRKSGELVPNKPNLLKIISVYNEDNHRTWLVRFFHEKSR